MRRTICSLMVLGVLSGCGSSDSGSGGGTAPAGDRQAPVVTLTAAGTIEGGNTTAITVTVTDNVDTGLTSTLTCDGGTVTGNLLSTTPVTANTTIRCTATATDKSGNIGTGNVSIVVTPRTTALTTVSGSNQVSAGGFGMLIANNLPLAQTSYDGTFNGRTVKLLRSSGNELLFFIPVDMPAGAGKLNVTIGTNSYSIDVTVGAAIAVANPREEVRAGFLAIKSVLNDALAGTRISAAERTTFQAQLPKIDQAIAALATVSDADMSKLASVLAAYGMIASRAPAQYNPIQPGQDCGTKAATFGDNLVLALAGAAILYSSLDIGLSLIAVAPGFAIPEAIITAIGAGYGGYALITYGRKAIQARKPFFTSCWTETTIDFLPDNLFTTGQRVQAIAVTAKQSFQQNETRSFRVQRTFSPAAQVRAEVERYATDIASVLAVSGILPDDVRAGFAEFKSQGTENIPVSRLSLGTISRSDIAGTLGGSGDIVTLKFGFRDPVPTTTTNVDFTFTLKRTEEGDVSVPAQLSIALPEADDAALDVIQGTPTTSNVQVRGATTLEVVTQPAHGTVALQNNGTFTYTPSLLYFGADQFTYRARNPQGVSTTATVKLSVVRKFDGVWKITSRSTTTSQSAPGLCPNETNNFSVTITKSTDTLYTSSYQGVPINLTMTSRDDPAGLSGRATETYDDGPGRTTETITVFVLDSTHITGAGSFSYTGPGNSSCSGTTQITGTR